MIRVVSYKEKKKWNCGEFHVRTEAVELITKP